MNEQQQQARDRAVQVLQHYVRTLFDSRPRESSPGYTTDVHAEIAGIVDDIIIAATLPAMTAHEAAVADLRRHGTVASDREFRPDTKRVETGEMRLHDGEGDVERMINEGSVGTGPDRNV